MYVFLDVVGVGRERVKSIRDVHKAFMIANEHRAGVLCFSVRRIMIAHIRTVLRKLTRHNHNNHNDCLHYTKGVLQWREKEEQIGTFSFSGQKKSTSQRRSKTASSVGAIYSSVLPPQRAAGTPQPSSSPKYHNTYPVREMLHAPAGVHVGSSNVHTVPIM